ncbi:inner-membrane translocator [Streptomyces paradoxus]|uniref:inner-membrane translocator n=1 Tax=Streptomyces paradoxus TaxID=66375 RepID=UPI0037CD90DB
MTEPADKHPPKETDAVTAGCLLLLVLVADVAAGLLVFIVLVARGWSRRSGLTAADSPPVDWTPVLSFGALALAVGVTGLLLLRVGNRAIGALQLVLCVVVAGYALTLPPL